MTEEVIRQLLNHPEAPIQDIPKYLATQILRITRLKNRLSAHKQKLEKLKEEYEAAVKREKEEFLKIQAECKHESQSFNPDPAGGRDSWHECDICGKTK